MARGKVASDALKLEAARRLGLSQKLTEEGWRNLTSGEIGAIVREMIRMGEEALFDDSPRLY
ncbi:MAG TPA: small, acid-soluble spore protein, alpha/beta type [Firmicutes bacterium]|nr:small, acid-soluble spore protein, alpha/beta type [Bacillota bacterium]